MKVTIEIPDAKWKEMEQRALVSKMCGNFSPEFNALDLLFLIVWQAANEQKLPKPRAEPRERKDLA
jgi:hypothetical protein